VAERCHRRGLERLRELRLDEALVQLRQARQWFESAGDRAMVVDCLRQQARAFLLKEHPAALSLAEETLRYCQSHPDEVPAVSCARALAQLGSVQVAHHDWVQGIRLLWAALDTQWPLCEISLVASIFGDLTVVWVALGDLGKALAYGRRALHASEVAGEAVPIARAKRNLAMAQVRAGRLAEAETLLKSALAGWDRLGSEAGLAHLLLGFTELHVARRQPDRAWADAVRAAQLAEERAEWLTLAAALEWLGRRAEQAGDPGQADDRFARALDLLGAYGAAHLQVDCHVNYAQLLEARGASHRALLHYRDAARLARRTRRVQACASVFGRIRRGRRRASPSPAGRPAPGWSRTGS
jgi:tetratricopeptide (TPR) repeat protein